MTTEQPKELSVFTDADWEVAQWSDYLTVECADGETVEMWAWDEEPAFNAEGEDWWAPQEDLYCVREFPRSELPEDFDFSKAIMKRPEKGD